MGNNMLFEYLLKYDNLKDITYSNGKLSYQGKNINPEESYNKAENEL